MRRLWILLLFVASTAQAQSVTRGPYVQLPTPDSVVIVWRTDPPTDGFVLYGDSPRALNRRVTSPLAGQHEVRIEGLSPSRRYYYAIGAGVRTLGGGDDAHWFETSPAVASQANLRAWIVGDSGTGGSRQRAVMEAMLAFTRRRQPDIFLHMGDMAYDAGRDDEFQQKFFDVYQPVLRNTPVWPTMGNHEGRSADSASESGPYYDAYVLPRAAEAGGLPSGTEAYYSFDRGHVHFVVLDSYESSRRVDGAMMRWLEADLDAADAEWLIAYWHHPPYTKGSHDSDRESRLIDMREVALPILEAAGVDLVLAGHSHIYERSFLIDGAYETPSVVADHIVDGGDGRLDGDGPYGKRAGAVPHEGAVYIVAGHGGAGARKQGDHPLMYRSEETNGSCILDVDGNVIRLTNVRWDGEVTDRFTMVKGPATIITAPNRDRLVPGTHHEIRWHIIGPGPSTVGLEYAADGGRRWFESRGATPNDGHYEWLVPNAPTDGVRVRIVESGAVLATSAPFTIGPPLVSAYPASFGDFWRYHDQDVDFGTSWRDVVFDDRNWREGAGELGYGDGNEATALREEAPNIPTVYFRKPVDVDGVPMQARLRVRYDDGVGVWINGQRVLSRRISDPGHRAYASSTSSDNETVELELDPNVLKPGHNLIAVMVKQRSATSSDLSFDLALTASVAEVTVNAPPVITGVHDRAVLIGESVQLVVTASDPDGNPLHFELLDAPSGARFDVTSGDFTWTSTAVGTWPVRFAAIDALGAEAIAAASLVVRAPHPPPDAGVWPDAEVQMDSGPSNDATVARAPRSPVDAGSERAAIGPERAEPLKAGARPIVSACTCVAAGASTSVPWWLLAIGLVRRRRA